jgi:hypothetical protein
MTVLESLKSISGYPLSRLSLVNITEEVGLAWDAYISDKIRSMPAYKRAKARVYLMLSEAPNVSQGGITYSFSDEDRKRFRMLAQALLEEVGDDTSLMSDNYGWQGEDL